MHRLLFESSPVFILGCILIGLAYAYVLYNGRHNWSPLINKILFAIRAITVAVICFLLIGPIIKLTSNYFEKPVIVFLLDNSASLNQTDTIVLQKELETAQKAIQDRGYEVVFRDLDDKPFTNVRLDNTTSDLSGAMRNVVAEYEAKNMAGMVLVSDGIYNSGSSPLYAAIHLPVYTIGYGDTTEHADLILKNVEFNKIAYQGNKFPVRAEVIIQGMADRMVNVSVSKEGRLITTLQKNTEKKHLLEFDFLVDASEKGMQRFEVTVAPLREEMNRRNNTTNIFVEVIQGKKKIVVIAPAPHPDIKALRSVIERNANYEFVLHIPGISKTDGSLLMPGKAELVIFHNPIDATGRTLGLFNQLSKGPSSILLILGSHTNLRQLNPNGIPVVYESQGQLDDVTPVVNPSFHDFSFSENANGIFARYPPLEVPFGKFTYPAKATVMLYQRIGNVPTTRPLLMVWEESNHKVSLLTGEGFWKWRINEYAGTGKTEIFDDTFSKLIQYLSTLDEKKKFKCFPIQNEFSSSGPVILESQVYNDLYELVYGNTINIELRDEKGKVTKYSYVTSAGTTQYRIGGLQEGIYQFKASSIVGEKTEQVNGQFLVKAQSVESLNLTADYGLLRNIASATGGEFYTSSNWKDLVASFDKKVASAQIHSEESFNPLINLKLIFFLILIIISAEWFVRKYLGSY